MPVSGAGTPQASATSPLRIEPRFVERIWGGNRFESEAGPVGEVWLVHEDNVISCGDAAALTLAEMTRQAGISMLGERLWQGGERRFPLLLKLIDAQDWLSIQVHPDDALAAELEGEGFRGKTEAWYVVDAESGAEVISGVHPGTTQSELASAIRDGSIESLVERAPITTGDVLGLPAGTVHALGPGIFLYEIQQSSDLTYRVFDWNRPATAGRSLHFEESVRAANPELSPKPKGSGAVDDGELRDLVSLEPFVLSKGFVENRTVTLEPGGEVFFILTVVDGSLSVTCANADYRLEPYGTLLIPAASETCKIEGNPFATFLVTRPA